MNTHDQFVDWSSLQQLRELWKKNRHQNVPATNDVRGFKGAGIVVSLEKRAPSIPDDVRLSLQKMKQAAKTLHLRSDIIADTKVRQQFSQPDQLSLEQIRAQIAKEILSNPATTNYYQKLSKDIRLKWWLQNPLKEDQKLLYSIDPSFDNWFYY